MSEIILDVRNLKVDFETDSGVIHAVDDISFQVKRGQTLGIVGESGSGKTTLALAIMRLISSDGPVVFMGDDLQGRNSVAPKSSRH
ncbi:MAG: ATP-binding cassette domain-containing protein, partial [Cyanobacteria bacterium J06629_9]